MLRILIVGCGDVGLRAARLLRGKARVFGLLRNPERAGLLRAAGVMPILGDLDEPSSLHRLAGLADLVLHFAPPPGEGAGDPRTRRLLSALNRSSLPRRLVYVSTSGVYGDCGGACIDETRPVRPHNMRAKRRVDAEARLRDWGRRSGVRVSILRAPGIYADGRMPEERVRKGLPALRADEDIHTNHIHADDLARLALFAAFRGAPGRVYHAVDDSGLKMGDWFDVVADHLGLARPPRLAKAEVMAAVTPAMRSFLTESRRLSNRRIKAELGFHLHHPDVRAVLAPHPTAPVDSDAGIR
jgi:nucleoside-diphosphate-sugar epimerase